MNPRKLLRRAIDGPANLRFEELTALVEAFGFRLSRQRGSHHIYTSPGISELVNLQNASGKAKPYQVRQFLKLVERYDLRLTGDTTEDNADA